MVIEPTNTTFTITKEGNLAVMDGSGNSWELDKHGTGGKYDLNGDKGEFALVACENPDYPNCFNYSGEAMNPPWFVATDFMGIDIIFWEADPAGFFLDVFGNLTSKIFFNSNYWEYYDDPKGQPFMIDTPDAVYEAHSDGEWTLFDKSTNTSTTVEPPEFEY